MCLISDIEEFKLKYDSTDNFITENKLSENVLEYYISNYEVKWSLISKHQTLTEAFIEQYNDKVIWLYISGNQTLSESFIIKYKDKVNWIDLFRNKKITLRYEFILKYLYEFNLYEISIDNADSNINRLVSEYKDKYNIDRLTYEFNKNN